MSIKNGNGTQQLDPQTNDRIEEVLNEKTQKVQTLKKPTRKSKKGSIQKASDKVNEATANAAQQLVKADKAAKKVRIQSGIQQGEQDAKDIRQGYQIGLLKGLTKAKVEDTIELASQLGALQDFTNEETEIDLEEEEGESDPLEALLELSELSNKMTPPSESFKIFAD